MLKCGRSICIELRADAVLGSAVNAISMVSAAIRPVDLDKKLEGFIGFSWFAVSMKRTLPELTLTLTECDSLLD
jgi:hypothetical protein